MSLGIRNTLVYQVDTPFPIAGHLICLQSFSNINKHDHKILSTKLIAFFHVRFCLESILKLFIFLQRKKINIKVEDLKETEVVVYSKL